MAIDGMTLLWLELIVLLAAFVQGVVGFAFGMITMGLGAFLIDARTASILIAPLAGANIAFVLWSVRREVRPRIVLPMIAGMLAGLPFGLMILLGGSTRLIRLLIGVLLIYVGLSRLIPRKVAPRPLPLWWGSLAGVVGGVLGGAVNIGGPPLIAYAVRQMWSPGVFKASLLATFMVGTTVKTLILIVHGALDVPLLLTVAALLPSVIAGSLLGIALFNRVDRRRFAQIVAVLVILLGVGLLR